MALSGVSPFRTVNSSEFEGMLGKELRNALKQLFRGRGQNRTG